MLVKSSAMLMSRATTPTRDISSYIAGKYATTQRDRVKLAAPVKREGEHVFDVNYKTPRPLFPHSRVANVVVAAPLPFSQPARSILNLMNLWPSVFGSSRKKI